MRSEIAVYIAGDEKIMIPAIVSLRSCKERGNIRGADYFVITNSFHLSQKEKDLADCSGIQIIDISDVPNANCIDIRSIPLMPEACGRWPVEIMINWAMPEYFFRLGYKKALKLDYDTLILGDLSTLFGELDLFLVSARKDPASCVLTSATRTKVSHIISRILKKECCVSKIPFSINAGVVIFDCEWSHEVSFFSCFINIYQELIKNKDPIQFYEQAAAALIFQNLHDGFYLLDKEYNLYGRHEYISSKLAKKDPAIIHYIGGVKPWEMDFASYLRRSESLRNNSPDLPYVNWLWLSYAKQHEDIVSATPIPDLTPEQVYYLGQTYFKIESEPAKIQRHKEYSDE